MKPPFTDEEFVKPCAHLVGSRVPRDRARAGRASLAAASSMPPYRSCNSLYILVGGWAVNMYGYIRATVDLDIWILADADNAKKVYAAVAEFGAPVSEMKPEEFAEYGLE